MRLYDVEQSAQSLIQDAAPADIPDKPINTFGTRERRDFSGFKT
jgi:hypothetical protein